VAGEASTTGRGPVIPHVPPRERLCFRCLLPDCRSHHPLCLHQQVCRAGMALDWVRPLLDVLQPGESEHVRFEALAAARRALGALCRAILTEGACSVRVDLQAGDRRTTIIVQKRTVSPPSARYRDISEPDQVDDMACSEEAPVYIRYATIQPESDVNGPGRRTVIYLQGCPIRCPGCQNAALWPLNGGQSADCDRLAAELVAVGNPVTITGGEPFAQPEALFWLVSGIRMQAPDLHLIVYSGLALEDLVEYSAAIPQIAWTLKLIDVLVDGPYCAELDDDHLQYRGSRNQRPIDVLATLVAYPHILDPASHEPAGVVVCDWDAPELVVTPEGALIGAAGLIEDLFGKDAGDPAPMCGQIEA
jgi:anaerobic ribonucleoside-triphosphate reductase activating protein